MTLRYELSTSDSRTQRRISVGSVKRAMQVVAFAFTLIATMAILVLPSYVTVLSESLGRHTFSSDTVLHVVGPAVLGLLAIPLIVAALPLFARDDAWQPASIASAILLAAFALVAIVTVGIFYIPAVIAAITAASMKPRR